VLVSVVVATHNYAHYLGQAIASIQEQTYPDWECVIVDDGSSDDTPRVVDAIADPRVRFIRQPQAGPAAARNRGLESAKGDLIQFLDADDLLGPAKLENQVRILLESPEVDLVYCAPRYFRDVAGETKESAPTRVWIDLPPLPAKSGSGQEVLPGLIHENFAVVEGPLFRRALADRAGGFDPALRRMEDWEYWIRCAVAGGRFLYDPREDRASLCHVRLHDASSSRDRIAMLQDSIRVRRKIHDRLPTRQMRRMNQRRANEQSAELGIREGLEGESASGIRRLVRSGFAEKQPKWLAWAVLLPILRTRLGGRALNLWRSRKPPLPY
jgi:glycosyltransferase involved in cell wall biosynthesis